MRLEGRAPSGCTPELDRLNGHRLYSSVDKLCSALEQLKELPLHVHCCEL